MAGEKNGRNLRGKRTIFIHLGKQQIQGIEGKKNVHGAWKKNIQKLDNHESNHALNRNE